MKKRSLIKLKERSTDLSRHGMTAEILIVCLFIFTFQLVYLDLFLRGMMNIWELIFIFIFQLIAILVIFGIAGMQKRIFFQHIREKIRSRKYHRNQYLRD